jgi:hypothetical protein
MTELAARRILLQLFSRYGAFSIVVFDIDDFHRYENAVGVEVGARSLEVATNLLGTLTKKAGGELYVLDRDRLLAALPPLTHDEAILFARFHRVANDLLSDGKSTGGDAVIYNR